FFNDTATTEIYTLSLHDALPISRPWTRAAAAACPRSFSSTPGTVSTPSRTSTRPATTVCLADTGPQRSQASTGSTSAPAYCTPSCGQHTRSPAAPTVSSPISPERPRQAAPPLVAMSRTSRAVIPVGPFRCLPRSSAARDSTHRDALSVEADPSQPSPTGTPAARNSGTGAKPPP